MAKRSKNRDSSVKTMSDAALDKAIRSTVRSQALFQKSLEKPDQEMLDVVVGFLESAKRLEGIFREEKNRRGAKKKTR